MPLLKLETTVALADDKKKALLASLSKIVAGTIGKPEQYVMVTISSATILMSGKTGEAAFVDIRSIGGLNNNVNPAFIAARPSAPPLSFSSFISRWYCWSVIIGACKKARPYRSCRPTTAKKYPANAAFPGDRQWQDLIVRGRAPADN